MLRPYFCDLLDDDVRASFEAALGALGEAGARRGGRRRAARRRSSVPCTCTSGSATARRYTGRRSIEMPERYTTPVRLRLETARYVLAEDYVRALAVRDVLRGQVDALLQKCDALAAPDAADSGAGDRRVYGPDRHGQLPDPRADAAADAVVQPDRQPGGVAPVRHDTGRAPLRSSARRPARRDRAL